jgi:hypothetical protein
MHALMQTRIRRLWPVLKGVLALTILAGVAWQFARILRSPELDWEQLRRARPEWLAASGAFYLVGLGFPALYWWHLQRHLRQRPDGLPAIRAYYISHLGKYLPGKAWALVLRAGLIQGPRVHVGVAGMAAFYEVLSTMAGGVLWAALWFALASPGAGALPDWPTVKKLFDPEADISALQTNVAAVSEAMDGKVLAVVALILWIPVGAPVLPPLFNRLAHRVSAPFRAADAAPPPPVRWSYLAEAVLLCAGTWLLLGASLIAVFQAILKEPPVWNLGLVLGVAARFAVGYVASFLIFVVPGSLGVRELFLTFFLIPAVSAFTATPGAQIVPLVIVAVLILRLIWTIAEVAMSSIVYWLPCGPAV